MTIGGFVGEHGLELYWRNLFRNMCQAKHEEYPLNSMDWFGCQRWLMQDETLWCQVLASGSTSFWVCVYTFLLRGNGRLQDINTHMYSLKKNLPKTRRLFSRYLASFRPYWWVIGINLRVLFASILEFIEWHKLSINNRSSNVTSIDVYRYFRCLPKQASFYYDLWMWILEAEWVATRAQLFI